MKNAKSFDACSMMTAMFCMMLAGLTAEAKFTSREASLVRRIQGNVHNLKVDLHDTQESNERVRSELETATVHLEDLQSKIDHKNAAIASISVHLAHYEMAWSIVSLVVAVFVAFLMFRIVGFALPWGMVIIGGTGVGIYVAVFELPRFF